MLPSSGVSGRTDSAQLGTVDGACLDHYGQPSLKVPTE
jgi:hypothetical protein